MGGAADAAGLWGAAVTLLGVLALNKEVILGIGIHNRRELDKALVRASSLSS